MDVNLVKMDKLLNKLTESKEILLELRASVQALQKAMSTWNLSQKRVDNQLTNQPTNFYNNF